MTYEIMFPHMITINFQDKPYQASEVEAWMTEQGWTYGDHFVQRSRSWSIGIRTTSWGFKDPDLALMLKLAWG